MSEIIEETGEFRLKRRTVLGTIATGGLASTAGCAALEPPDPENIKVGLAGMETPDVGATYLRLPLIMEVYNGNDSPVPNAEVAFDALINGEPAAVGSTSMPAIGPTDSVKTTLVIVIDYGEVGLQVVEAIQSGSFVLTVDGEVIAKGPLGILTLATLPFELETRLS